MLSLPQTLKLDTALANGEASSGKAFSLGAGGSSDPGGFSATLRASRPVAPDTVVSDVTSGGRLPADGKALPATVAVSGPIKSMTMNTGDMPGATDLPTSVSGPLRDMLTLPDGIALADLETPDGESGLDLARLVNRMMNNAGQTESLAITVESGDPSAVASSPPEQTIAPEIALPATSSPALPVTELPDVPLNDLPDLLTEAIHNAIALPATTPYQGVDASPLRVPVVAREPAAVLQSQAPPTTADTRPLPVTELNPGVKQLPPGPLLSPAMRQDAPHSLQPATNTPIVQPRAAAESALPRGDLAALARAEPGVPVGTANPLSREITQVPAAQAAAAEILRPTRAEQNIARGGQTGPALPTPSQGSASTRAVSEALQMAQPAPLQDLTVSSATAQPRSDATLAATPFMPVRQDRFRGAPLTALKAGGALAATAAEIASAVKTGTKSPALQKADLLTGVSSTASVSTFTPSLAQPAATAAPGPVSQTLNLPVTDNAWGNALSERVAVLAGQKLTSADIRLNPAELGPLRVEIKVDDGNAQVNFTALHAVTREAIEQALPRLRELLSAEGLNLTGANVSEQGVRRDAGGQGDASGQAEQQVAGDVDNADLKSEEGGAAASRPGAGLVDTFA